MSETELVRNRYREHLTLALPGAQEHARRVGTAFARVDRAMAARAWESPLADAFYAECVAAHRAGADAAQRFVDEMESRSRREPIKVPRDDRRAWFS